MISKEIQEKAKGDPDCKLCQGAGMYMFQGTKIFCENCNSEEKITGLWRTVDAYLTKHIGPRYRKGDSPFTREAKRATL